MNGEALVTELDGASVTEYKDAQILVRLPDSFIQALTAKSESGMGYQNVTVSLNTGERVDCLVLNCEFLVDPTFEVDSLHIYAIELRSVTTTLSSDDALAATIDNATELAAKLSDAVKQDGFSDVEMLKDLKNTIETILTSLNSPITTTMLDTKALVADLVAKGLTEADATAFIAKAGAEYSNENKKALKAIHGDLAKCMKSFTDHLKSKGVVDPDGDGDNDGDGKDPFDEDKAKAIAEAAIAEYKAGEDARFAKAIADADQKKIDDAAAAQKAVDDAKAAEDAAHKAAYKKYCEDHGYEIPAE
jgi:hypothetical protein